MSITRLQFRTALRDVLSDQVQWRDSMLNSWIDDAIRDYSAQFPQHAAQKLNCTTGVHGYTLTATGEYIQSIISVEYPADEDPPRYLQFLSKLSANFYGNPFYDTDEVPIASIIIGESPTTGEKINIWYHSQFVLPTDDTRNITAPDIHHELLRLFIIWKAVAALELDENVSVQRKAIMLGSLGLNTVRAERLYRNRVRDIKASISQGFFTGPWPMDTKDRIY